MVEPPAPKPVPLSFVGTVAIEGRLDADAPPAGTEAKLELTSLAPDEPPAPERSTLGLPADALGALAAGAVEPEGDAKVVPTSFAPVEPVAPERVTDAFCAQALEAAKVTMAAINND